MRANNVFVDYLVFTDCVHLSLSCFLFSLFVLKMTVGVEQLPAYFQWAKESYCRCWSLVTVGLCLFNLYIFHYIFLPKWILGCYIKKIISLSFTDLSTRVSLAVSKRIHNSSESNFEDRWFLISHEVQRSGSLHSLALSSCRLETAYQTAVGPHHNTQG